MWLLKCLRFIQAGRASASLNFKKKAYETIKEAEAQDPGKQLAKVPLPYFYRESDISQNEALQRKVKGANVNSLNKRIEVILMDFIPGKDLATFLYQEVLKYHPKTKYLAQNKNKNGLTDLDEMNIEDLQMEVAQALEFSLPPTNGLFVDDRVIRVFNENKERLINFLQNQRKNGFKMPKDIWIKLKNTIELFKQNGFEHNDLHERNIIIGRDEEIYIIDFGAAKTVNEKENELKMGTETDIERAKIEQTLRQDRAILSTIEQLSRDIEQEAKNEDERKLAELINIIEQIIDKKPDVKQELVKLKEINKADELLEEIDKIVLTNEMSSSNLEAQAQIEAGLLYKFLQENAGVFNNEQLKKIYSVYKKHYPYAYQQKLISLIIKKFLK